MVHRRGNFLNSCCDMSRQSRRITDILHKSVVTCLVGLTLYGAVLVGFRFYNYFTVIRPAHKQRQALAEKTLLTDSSSEESPVGN